MPTEDDLDEKKACQVAPQDMEELRKSLAEKGYDIMPDQGGLGNSDDEDEDPFPGRIPNLPPAEAKEKGNKAFHAGKYDKAIRCWQGGLKSILSTLCSGPEAMSNTSLSELDLTLNLNIAMAYMKKEDYDSAERSVEKALARREALPPHLIVKALYRKASAQRAMRRLEETLETLKDLLEVEPGHAAALQMQQEVDRQLSREKRDQKKNFRKLWAALEGEDKQEQDRQAKELEEIRQQCGIQWADGDVDSIAFASGEASGSDGKDWSAALNLSVLWSMEQLALNRTPCMSSTSKHVSIWFVGASSTCELRWVNPATLLTRLPGVETLELALIGFIGELDPDNKRIPDPNEKGLPKGFLRKEMDGGKQQSCTVVFKGTLAQAVDDFQKNPDEESESATNGDETAAGGDEPPPAPATSRLSPTVPPTICVIAHPQLHRYFSEFHPAISWLIEKQVPTIVIGASEPDPSWKQDEVLLKSLGCNIVLGKRLSPYPMCLPDNADIRKCNHIIGFCGGKALPKERLTKMKLELLTNDYTVR